MYTLYFILTILATMTLDWGIGYFINQYKRKQQHIIEDEY